MNTKMKTGSGRTNLSIVFVLVAALLPFMLGANPSSENSLKANREAIQRMTKPERKRLVRNLEAFQKLTPAEKEKYQQMHKELDQDQIDHPSGHLRQEMEQYIEWLNTLSPYTRQQLNDIKDPAKRVQLVRIILQKQNRDMRYMRLAIYHKMSGKDQLRRRIGRGPVLSSVDLESVFAAVEKTLDLDEIDLEDLKELKGAERYVYLLRLVIIQNKRSKGKWLTTESLQEMVSQISEPEIVKYLFQKSVPEEKRKAHMGGLLIRSIYIDEISQKLKEQPPSPAELSRHRKKTSLKSKELLNQLPPAQQEEMVKWMYAVEKFSSDSALRSSKMRTILPNIPLLSRPRRPDRRPPFKKSGERLRDRFKKQMDEKKK